MTKTERLRIRIEAQEEVIRRHEEKIEHERRKPLPNGGLIHHWGAEIRAAEEKIERLQRRLSALRRRG